MDGGPAMIVRHVNPGATRHNGFTATGPDHDADDCPNPRACVGFDYPNSPADKHARREACKRRGVHGGPECSCYEDA